MTLNGAVGIASLAFASGTLRLADPGQVSSTVHGFGNGDLIDVEASRPRRSATATAR